MALLTGGVTATNELPPLEGNVTQNVDKNTASAGGNVFNQVYAPAIDTTGLQRIPTVLPAATISNISPGTVSPVQFTPQTVVNSPYQRIPSVPLNLPSGANVIGGVQYSPNQLLAYNPTPGGPSFRPQQAQSDGGGAPPVAPSFDQPRPSPAPQQAPQLMPMRPSMEPRPLISPETFQQIESISARYPIRPNAQMLQGQSEMDTAAAYARRLATQGTIPQPVYSPMARFMQGLTRNNQAAAIAQQRGIAQYNAQVMQNQRAGVTALSQIGRTRAEQAGRNQRAEAKFTHDMIKKVLSEPPTPDNIRSQYESMLKMWPDPTDPGQLQARREHKEAILEATGGMIDLTPWVHLPATGQIALLEGRNLRNQGTKIKNEIADRTKESEIEKRINDAAASKLRTNFLARTLEDRVKQQQLNTERKQFELDMLKNYGATYAELRTNREYMNLVQSEVGLLESNIKGANKIVDDWNRLMTRWEKAANVTDSATREQLKGQVGNEIQTFGPMGKNGVPLSVEKARNFQLSQGTDPGDIAFQEIRDEIRSELNKSTIGGVKQFLASPPEPRRLSGKEAEQANQQVVNPASIPPSSPPTSRRMTQPPAPGDLKATVGYLNSLSKKDLEQLQDLVNKRLGGSK